MSSLENLLGREHPDIKYLSQDKIQKVIAKALTETYGRKPNDPIAFFAKYLINHVNQEKVAEAAQEKSNEEKRLRIAHKKEMEAEQVELEKVKTQALTVEEKKAQFFRDIKKSTDLNDNLQDLTNFIQEHTGATGVYIGYLQAPEMEIDDNAEDGDHLDKEKPQIIKFTHATDNHKFVVGGTLEPEEGITHEVFAAQEEDEEPVDEGSEDGKPKEKAEVDILKGFKHVYVKEVVREPKMHFQKVPRLGSYMAVPLIYHNCLSDQALDRAVEDHQEIALKLEEQKKERDLYDEEQAAAKESKLAAGEPWEEEEKNWETFEAKEFETTEEKFVVCLDTLGQDREFSEDQRRFVLNTVKRYREMWDQEQRDNLTRDRDDRLTVMAGAQPPAEGEPEPEEQVNVIEEMEKEIEEQLTERAEEFDGDDEKKEMVAKQMRLTKMGGAFIDDENWQKELQVLTRSRVLKMPAIVKSTMYMLGFKKEEICEPNSQTFWWKVAKKFVESRLPKAMREYQVLGQKQGEFKVYQTLNYCSKIIDGMEQENVDTYNPTFGKIFKWLRLAIDTRKVDITTRKAMSKKARENRESLIQQSSDRDEARAKMIEETEEQFKTDHTADFEAFEVYTAAQEEKANQDYGSSDEDEEGEAKEPPQKPVFEAQEHYDKFDEENPPIEIPEEIPIEVDNDWPMNEEEEEELIKKFWAEKEQ